MSLEARAQAIEPTGCFLVQAPAGSGKTELLTRRILKLLSVVEEPEEILALTFTRKAASEMRGRVIGALRMPKPTDPDSHQMETWLLAQQANSRSDECGWHLSEHPSRLRIMTLDSFAFALAGQLPLLSGLGDMPAPSVHVEPLYREAAEIAIHSLIRSHPDQAAAVLLHQDHNMLALIRLIADMLGKRDQWLHQIIRHRNDMAALRIEQESLLKTIMAQQLVHCAGMIPDRLRQEMPAVIRFAGENLGDDVLASLQSWPEAELDQLPVWQLIAELMLVKNGTAFRKSVNKNSGFPAGKAFAGQKGEFLSMLEQMADIDGLAVALDNLRKLPSTPGFDEGQWQVLEGLFSLLLEASARLKLLFSQRGEADFIEIAVRAMDAIEDEQGRPTDLLMRLDYRIHHVLIDEFQDTSQLQMRLLQNLTEGWHGADATNRSLFMVGDPMQSIYRFRKAEVSLFLQVAAHEVDLPETQSLQLQQNFRSSPVIVDWVNRAFATIFPDQPDALMAAVGHATASAALEHDGAVNLYLQQGRDDMAEAKAVVETIQQELKREGSRIAVLARSRKHLHAIMQALAGACIAFRAVDILPLDARPEVRLLRALLRALLHPADRESWAALLRSPCCGLDTGDLHRLLGADARPVFSIIADDERLLQLGEGARRRICFLRDALMPCIAQAGRVPVRPLLNLAWQRLAMPGLIEAGAEINVEAMLDLVEQTEDGGLIDFSLLDERLEKLYAAPDTSEAASRIELLTMHGAKGLQWDMVILPGLGKSSGRSDSPLLAFTDVPVHGELNPLVAVRGAVRSSDAVYNLVHGIEKIRENNELSRLLYVACTRAVTALKMFGHVSDKEGQAAAGSLLKLLMPNGADGDCFGASVSMQESVSLHGTATVASLRRISLLPEINDIPEADDSLAESEYFWAGSQAAPIGNAVHAALQHVACTGTEYWSGSDTAEEVRRIRRSLMAEGLSGAMLEDAILRCEKALLSTLASSRGRDILSARHTEAHCEWELSSCHDGFVSHHIIDRSYVDENNVRWIIDYKTATHEGGDLDAFLNEEVNRHTPQLQRYAAIVARLEPEREIRTALYFPMLDAWREVAI